MNDEVAISVWLLYGGPKADYFTGRSNDLALVLLRADLVALKLPHPKRENIDFISRRNGARGCSFFWPRIPAGGLLQKQIESRVRSSANQELLKNMAIVSLTCRQLPAMSANSTSRRLSSANSRPTSTSEQWAQQEEYSNSSRPVTAPVHVKIDEAEELLHSMNLTPQSSIRVPKIEPVDPPSLFDAFPPPREDSVASSRPSVPPEVPPQPISARGPQIVMESERLPDTGFRRPPSPQPHSNRSTPMSISPPPSALSNHQHQRPTISIPSARTGTPEFSPPGFIKIQPTSPTIPRKRLHTPDPESDPRPAIRPPPNPSDVPTIQKLTRELWDLRRKVTAGVARETAIIKELRALNSSFVPEPSTHVKPAEDRAMKTRLEAVESELRAERKRREEVEAALNDIERECREPFLVPALFEAFVSISKITSQAMDQDP